MTVTLKQHERPAASRIVAVGAYHPANLVPNEDLIGPIDSSDEWIRQRTGIVTRQRATAEETVPVMAVGAAREALERAGLQGSDLDAVIVSTVTFPHATPSAAALVAHEIGATPAPAYDVSAACAGYCYGVAQADALVRSGTARHVLVVGVERLSDVVDPTDRSISFLLGDGAGAVIVSASDEPGISPSVWGSDGERWSTISMTHSQLELRDAVEHARTTGDASAITGAEGMLWPTLRQDGPSVFRWAVWSMAKVAREALDAAGVEPEDLAAFIPHQANMRIIDEFAKQLKLPESVVVARDIADAGNTSAASIPLAMHRLLEENPELTGGLALQIGFAPGWSTAPRWSASPEAAPSDSLITYTPHPYRRRRPMASKEEILAGLAEIVNEETGLDTAEVQPEKSFTDDLDIDSISMMTIVVNAEDKFGVKIPDEEVKNLKTVQDAVDFIDGAQA